MQKGLLIACITKTRRIQKPFTYTNQKLTRLLKKDRLLWLSFFIFFQIFFFKNHSAIVGESTNLKLTRLLEKRTSYDKKRVSEVGGSRGFNFIDSCLIFYKLVTPKDVRQGKFIAVVYTLRTYWNQFSLGGICKQ